MTMLQRIRKALSRKAPPPPELKWHVQHACREPLKTGDRRLIHFAHSTHGVYEIYDHLDGTYLLCCPLGTYNPAELFYDLDAAKGFAEDAFAKT